jgi:hypothetical protein
LTDNLVDEAGHPTIAAQDYVLFFFAERLKFSDLFFTLLDYGDSTKTAWRFCLSLPTSPVDLN